MSEDPYAYMRQDDPEWVPKKKVPYWENEKEYKELIKDAKPPKKEKTGLDAFFG